MPIPASRLDRSNAPCRSGATPGETVRFGERLPAAVTECTYCGCEVEAHDPVFVAERRDGERVPAGQFCNYGCLSIHVEEAGLAEGARCRFDG